MKINRLITLFFVGACICAPTSFAASLDKIEEVGIIKFAAYDDFLPYSYADKQGKPAGIDIDIGKALAKELGVKPTFRLVYADESLEDDLRVYVWKGHHVTGPPADVMLHIPYEQNLIEKEDKVSFIAPYSEEQVVVAADPEKLGANPQLQVFFTEKIGVEKVTMADGYLLGAYQGRIMENVVHFDSILEATQALLNKELPAIMGTRTEIEAGLGDSKANYQIGLMPMPAIAKASWDLGIAVKSGNEKLVQALDAAMKKLIANGTIKEIFNENGVSFNRSSASLNF